MRTSWLPYPSRSKSKKSTSHHQGANLILGHPVLFSWPILVIVLLVLLLAAFQHIVPLLAVTVFVPALAGISWLWSWYSLRRMSYRLTSNTSRVFPGEKVDLEFEVTNSKRLFLTWLEIEVELPHRLVTGKLRIPSPYIKERLRWTTSISGGQQIAWKHRLECRARGSYRLEPVRLRSGDIFGLFPREMILPCSEELLVYPKIVPVENLALPLKGLTGERVVPRTIYEDVSMTIGTRDYLPHDPLKRIHWKASARYGQLQTRQYESTTSLSLLFMLDVHSFCSRQTQNEETFELAVTTVASLAYEAYRENSPVGLIANSVPEIQIPVRGGRSQLLLLLEALARIQAESRLPLHQQLDNWRSKLPLGTTLVIITENLSVTLSRLLRQLQQEGHSLAVVSVGEKIPLHNIGNIPVISVPSAGAIFPDYRTVKS